MPDQKLHGPAITLQNAITGERRHVRFGSPELHRLKSIPHPVKPAERLWEQVYDLTRHWL